MKYFIEPREKKRLKETHFVEFNAIFSPKELQEFCEEIFLLEQRGISYNFFHHSSSIKKMEIILGKIATDLLDIQSIRLCFDAVYTKQNIALSLEEISSYQPLLLGAAIILNEEYHNTELFPLPSDAYAMTFFSSTEAINFNAFPEDLKVFIIGFSHAKSVYYYNSKDPFTSVIRQEKTDSGSLLQDIDHPLIRHW